VTTSVRDIVGFRAALTRRPIAAESVALWQVADLERHVDRAALLSANDAPEPPYWAHVWSGAEVLASAVPSGAGTALELGCGLGLAGLVAARRGWRVTFVDRVMAPLHFVRASAEANGVVPMGLVVEDFTRPAVRARFDLVLAAEVLYDRAAFAPLVTALDACLAPGGRVLIADAARIDTRAFDIAVAAAGFRMQTTLHRVAEERLPLTVRLLDIVRG
jgi:predicted nicotinamide N-methyase